MNLFQVVMFWIFWREKMIFWYEWKEPLTPKNCAMRVLNTYLSNIIPPFFMLFDFFFSKTLFRIRHCWVPFVVMFIYWAIMQGDENLTRYEGPIFPDGTIKGSPAEVLGMFLGYACAFIILAVISQIKYRLLSKKMEEEPISNEAFEERIDDYIGLMEEAIK